MFIGSHEVVAGYCLHCGAREDAINASVSENTPLTCKGDTIVKGETIMPEPTLRVRAADDFDEIGKRIEELRKEGAA